MRGERVLLLAALMADGNVVHAQDAKDAKEQARVAALSEGLYACPLIVAPKGSEVAKLADPLPSESIIETANAIGRSGSDTRADWEFEFSAARGFGWSAPPGPLPMASRRSSSGTSSRGSPAACTAPSVTTLSRAGCAPPGKSGRRRRTASVRRVPARCAGRSLPADAARP